MAEFLPGQRCISDAELQMGLGTILTVETRTLTVLFMATGETRTYAIQSAPLTRVLFSVGDNITRHDGLNLTVKETTENHGLISYSGIDANGEIHQVEEAELDNFIQLNRPSNVYLMVRLIRITGSSYVTRRCFIKTAWRNLIYMD